jgi:signal transduction histidine kinase
MHDPTDLPQQTSERWQAVQDGLARLGLAVDLTELSAEDALARIDAALTVVALSQTPIPLEAVACSSCDITDHLQAVQERERLLTELQQRSAELEATFTAIPGGIIIYDLDGNIQQINAEARRISGYADEDVRRPVAARMAQLRMARADGTPFPPSESPAYRAVRYGETVLGEIMVLHLPDQIRWTTVSAAPIRGAEGQILGAIASLTDITRLHDIQETQRLFVHTVSHDLRIPLTVIHGHTQMLEALLARPEAETERQACLRAIQRNALRMDTMIHDLMEMARVEGGQLRLARQPIDIAAYLPELLARLEPALPVARVTLELAAGLPPVSADPDRLDRIVTNLLSNALKYSEPDAPVAVRATAADGVVALAVRDNGRGIPAEHLPRIFERFYRIDDARKADGLGIGLYITRLLAEAHGGQIAVESQPGAGSTFTCSLPRA